MENLPQHKIFNFLRQFTNDDLGRNLSDYWDFDDQTFENLHNFIQWMFPTDQKSKFNKNAPILTKLELTKIRLDESCKLSMWRSTDRALKFYSATNNWHGQGDHNHLRISRIVRSLTLILGPKAGQYFLKSIESMLAHEISKVSPISQKIWHDNLKADL